MAGKRHPDVTLERGICVLINVPCGFQARHHRHYQIIGRLECGTPFLLDYAGGVTHWQCPLPLGDGACKKILSKVRKEIRHAVATPDYVLVHDLRATEESRSQEVTDAAATIRKTFFDDVWRATYLNDRDSDYVDLEVPFAEKEAAKQLGAKWDPQRRVWKVPWQDDMSAFGRWIPDNEAAPTPAA